MAQAEQNQRNLTLQVRLVDKFGDNGMISVVICEQSSDTDWLVDTWLMSCRVLKRKVEHAVLNEVVAGLKKRGANKLQGVYIPSPKNILVVDHYRNLGFQFVEERKDGSTLWELDLNSYTPFEIPMKLHHGI